MTDLQELMADVEKVIAWLDDYSDILYSEFSDTKKSNEVEAWIKERSPAFAEMARNDARYRMLRNGLSDFHGDCYAMTFDPDGDYPVSGADLDNRADRMISRHAQRHGGAK